MVPSRRALIGFCLAWTVATAAEPVTAPYMLAVHPRLPAAELQMRFRPFENFISQVLGRDRVDIAFLGPTEYVQVRRDHGAKPLLARFEVHHQTQLQGVNFVRRGSRLRTLADLKGKRFAFADRGSTMGHAVPEWVLAQAGVPIGALACSQFLSSHYDVVMAVLTGDYDAGAVKQEVFDQFKDQGLQALAVVPTTPDHVFVTRANFPAADIALVPATDADYDPVRRMLIDIRELRQQ